MRQIPSPRCRRRSGTSANIADPPPSGGERHKLFRIYCLLVSYGLTAEVVRVIQVREKGSD